MRAVLLGLKITHDIPKIEGYVENVISRYNLTTFKSHFRLTRITFELLLIELCPLPEFIKRNEYFGGREQISVTKTLLIALWVLATPDSYRSIGERFNVSKPTVYFSIKKIVNVLLTHLCQRFIKWPQENKAMILNTFERKYGLANVIGAIDGCHVPIKKPIENHVDYINRKKNYSVVLQAVCLPDLTVSNVDVRWPGSVNDARVLRTSDLFNVVEEYCNPDFYIVGGAAYPCLNWIIPPFKNNGRLTEQQIFFNTCLSQTRVVIERSFALLIGRFRRLKYLDMLHIEDINKTIVACCVFHNICLIHEDDFEEYIRKGLNVNDHVAARENHDIDDNGRNKRNMLVDLVWAYHHNQ